MGKGNRNRQIRDVQSDVEVVKAAPKKKKKRVRKPLSNTAKNIIEYAIVLTLVLAIVAGSLISAGTFKRANILVHSKTGDFDINQQMATYIIWSDVYDQYLSSLSENSSSTSSLTSSDYSSIISTSMSYAMMTVQEMLLTAIKGTEDSTGYGDALTNIVAICDASVAEKISLTKEEIKAAEDDAAAQVKSMAETLGFTTKRFIKNVIGCNVKMKDIKAVARLMALYNKVITDKQEELQGTITDELLAQYRDDNAESYYFTEFLAYELLEGEDELKEKLLAATSPEQFKTVLAESAFNASYKTVFNKHTVHADADALETALKNALTSEEDPKDLAGAIATESISAMLTADDETKTYTKDQEGLAKDVNDWIFGEGRQKHDVTQIEVKNADTQEVEAIYVVALADAPAENQASALIKKYDVQSGETYGEDDKFKDHILDTLLVDLELKDETDEMKLYDDAETDSAEANILKDLKNEIETKWGKTTSTTDGTVTYSIEKTEAYNKEITEDELKTKPYLDWMFDDTLTAPEAAVKGKTNTFSVTTTKDDGTEVTKNYVYCIVDPMKLDEDLIVDGGYVEFNDATTHATEAQSFYDSLGGATGADLAAKFTEKGGQVSETLFESSLTDKNLKAWLFDSARKANETNLIASEDKSYVAFFNDNVTMWKYTAENQYISEKLSEWMEGLSEDYRVEEKALKRIKDKTSATTTTEAAQ